MVPRYVWGMDAIQRFFTAFFPVHSSFTAVHERFCIAVGEPTSPWSPGDFPMEESK